MTSPDAIHRPPSQDPSARFDEEALLDAIPAPKPPAPVQWRVAWKRFGELLANPEETPRVFRFFDALGGSDEPVFQRFIAAGPGRALLARRPSLLRALADREALAALAPGSFGRAYLDFAERNGFKADGLFEARAAADRSDEDAEDPYRRWFGDRLTLIHDLWHVLTGYGTDEVGEAHLVAFSLPQMPIRSFRVLNAALVLRGPRIRRLLFHRGLWAARRRGQKAARLTTVDYEACLGLPLEQVRRELKIAPLALAHPGGLLVGSLDNGSWVSAGGVAEAAQ